jgi:hypothetical protein
MTYFVLYEGFYQMDVYASALVAKRSAIPLGKRAHLLLCPVMLKAEVEG